MGDHDDDDDDDDDRRGRAPRLTFPLPREEILKGKARIVGKSPVTRGAGLAAVLLLPTLIGTLGVLAGLAWYWKRRWPEVEAEAIAELVEERNESQDKDLSRSVKTLRRYKRYQDASRLESFLAIKRDIESAMHATPELDGEEMKLEGLVDTLCFEVKDELFRIADLHYALRKRRKRLSEERVAAMKESIVQLDERVSHAYETLLAARRNLEGLVGVGVPAARRAESNPVLDGAIATLREETEFAKRVRVRIEADMAAELAPWDAPASVMTASRRELESAS